MLSLKKIPQAWSFNIFLILSDGWNSTYILIEAIVIVTKFAAVFTTVAN